MLHQKEIFSENLIRVFSIVFYRAVLKSVPQKTGLAQRWSEATHEGIRFPGSFEMRTRNHHTLNVRFLLFRKLYVSRVLTQMGLNVYVICVCWLHRFLPFLSRCWTFTFFALTTIAASMLSAAISRHASLLLEDSTSFSFQQENNLKRTIARY